MRKLRIGALTRLAYCVLRMRIAYWSFDPHCVLRIAYCVLLLFGLEGSDCEFVHSQPLEYSKPIYISAPRSLSGSPGCRSRPPETNELAIRYSSSGGLSLPVQKHRGEPGHIRDTRAHTGTRITQTTVSGACPAPPEGSYRLNRFHGTNQLQTTLSAVRCAAERCLDDVLFRIPAMRGLSHHPPSYRPPDVCQSSSAGGAHRHARTPRGARTRSHNGTHTSSPHYMRACVRHTHPIAINCIPFGRRRPWKVLEERPRSRGEPSRAWPRAHHVALISLFDGTQRRSRPALRGFGFS